MKSSLDKRWQEIKAKWEQVVIIIIIIIIVIITSLIITILIIDKENKAKWTAFSS